MGIKDYHEYEHAVGEHWNRVHDDEWGCSGSVITQFGIVAVTCESGHYSYTSLLLVYNGKVHQRQWNESFSKRTLVTLAKRFAKEINEHRPGDKDSD